VELKVLSFLLISIVMVALIKLNSATLSDKILAVVFNMNDHHSVPHQLLIKKSK